MGEKAVVTFAGVRVAVTRAPNGGLLVNIGPVRKPKVGEPLAVGADGLVPLSVAILKPDGKPAQLLKSGKLYPSVAQLPQTKKVGRLLTWWGMARWLASRISDQAHCEQHSLEGADPNCRSCADGRAYQAYLAIGGKDFR